MATLKSVKGDCSSVNFHLNYGIKEEILKTRVQEEMNLNLGSIYRVRLEFKGEPRS